MNTSLSRSLRPATAALVLFLLLSGCGSKGSLYLQDPDADRTKAEAGKGK